MITQFKTLIRPFFYRHKRQFRRRSLALQRRIRLLSAQIRLLPDFIIIGAQKCGTTSLYNYLIHHPCVAPALLKEIHFFDLRFSEGLIWYRLNFATSFYKTYVKKRYGCDLVTGEASPYYIFHPHAPRRVFETLPQAKLIILLRNPVDRAYSHYQHQVRHNIEKLSFEEAIEAEPQRLAGELEKILADENYNSLNYLNFSYLARGIYVDQVKAWRAFFPQEQLLILNSHDFYANPGAVFKQVLGFLNLSKWELSEYRWTNRGNYQEAMKPAIRQKLIEYFRPHNQRLYEYLGVTFGWD